MKRSRLSRKAVCFCISACVGGTMLANNCLNFALSITPCGTIFPTTVCTPVDQLNLIYPLLQVPDFHTDPSCTIPFGCSTSDLFPPIVGGPGGGPSTPPTGGTGGT